MDSRKTLGRSPRDFLHILFKRKIQMLLVFGAALLTAALGLLVMKPKYEASSSLLIKVGRENVYVSPMSSGGASNPSNPVAISLNPEEKLNSEIQILLGPNLAKEVVERIGAAALYPDLNAWSPGFLRGLFRSEAAPASPTEKATMRLQDNLTVEPVKKSEVITVSFRHNDPTIAAVVVNQLVKLYLDRHVEVFKSPQPYEFFREQSQVVKEKLRRAEKDLLRFKEAHKLTDVPQQLALLVKNHADLQAALDQTSSQEAETAKRVQQIRESLAQTPQTVTLVHEVEHNPHAVSTLKAKLVDLELKERELTQKYKDQNSLVQGVREDIRTVRSALAAQEAAGYGRTQSGVNPTYQTLNQDLLRNATDLMAIQARKNIQKAQLAEHQRQMEQFNSAALEFDWRQQELENDRRNYRMYLTKFEDSRVSDAMDRERITNVSVIEPAIRPITPVGPKIPLILALAVVFGGVGAVGLAFVSEYLDDSLERAEHVETLLHLPVLASIPKQRT